MIKSGSPVEQPERSPLEPLVLVSASPRRRELLEQIGIPFVVEPVEVDESPTPGLAPVAQTIAIAMRKIGAYLEGLATAQQPSVRWALAADTLVNLDGRLIGKPATEEQAARVLADLSGRTHFVVTGLALYNPLTGGVINGSAVTEVAFARLSAGEIDWYVSTGEWKDVAGGYRIQGKGTLLIESFTGSYSNVMGLPTRAIYGMLQDQGHPYFPKGN